MHTQRDAEWTTDVGGTVDEATRDMKEKGSEYTRHVIAKK